MKSRLLYWITWVASCSLFAYVAGPGGAEIASDLVSKLHRRFKPGSDDGTE